MNASAGVTLLGAFHLLARVLEGFAVGFVSTAAFPGLEGFAVGFVPTAAFPRLEGFAVGFVPTAAFLRRQNDEQGRLLSLRSHTIYTFM